MSLSLIRIVRDVIRNSQNSEGAAELLDRKATFFAAIAAVHIDLMLSTSILNNKE